ncbi:MAG: 3-isopropylmalate dehydratase small subunit [Oscillospiraceae bacterium]|nr:3-isopropylmalate dehydratase small subunit [Oscillospiraceae bacterium]
MIERDKNQAAAGRTKISGKVHKYGDNVDTDVIIPARYLNTSSPSELAAHCMEDIDPGFAGRVRAGDVIVGGSNFGCGSSREHAPIAIKAAGVGLVVGVSFARIFYRNAINIGLPILECPGCALEAEAGDVIEADLAAGLLKNITKDKTYLAEPFPPFVREIIEVGGLLRKLKKKFEKGKRLG